jgi:hypothetical protein
MVPVKLGPWLVLVALACFALAVLLLVYRLIAAVIVAGVLGLAGLALFGLGTALWRAESAARKGGAGTSPPADPEVIRDAEATWRDGDERNR